MTPPMEVVEGFCLGVLENFFCGFTSASVAPIEWIKEAIGVSKTAIAVLCQGSFIILVPANDHTIDWKVMKIGNHMGSDKNIGMTYT